VAWVIELRKQGLYCEAGDFYIDPWLPVENALITHAHSDHARTGSKNYYVVDKAVPILKHRLGDQNIFITKKYGEVFSMKDVQVSFHSAGHILGSAQIRIERNNKVWVFSGDYKRGNDPSCDPFEVVPCDVFISECTFGLPVYKWEDGHTTGKKIFEWWQSDPERPSLLFCYALGKAQRVLAELTAFTNEPVYIHGAVDSLTKIYRDAGIKMLPTKTLTDLEKDFDFKGKLIIAPPSAHRSLWMKRFKDPQTAFASGWMQIRGSRRRKGYEKGFVLSDHADWTELNETIEQTHAKTVYLTHGKTDVLQRFLSEKGIEVKLFETQFDDVEDAS
jgi:putative mRNA 3-end processing factor